MIRAVFDASTVISGCGWGHESYDCLVMVARRRVRSFVTAGIVNEWKETLLDLQTGNTKFKRDPWPTLKWLIDISRAVEPSPLGKQRSRDPKDDPYLACALSSGAPFIISRDPHLLDMGKPFGIEIVTPRQMLNRLLSQVG